MDKIDNTQLINMLNKDVLLKKKLKYQIKKDVRFNDFKNKTIDDLAFEYSTTSKRVEEVRNILASEGYFVNWNSEDE